MATKLTLIEARATYPGFAVREGDLEREGDALFRVNSNGDRIDLKKWHFQTETGEFYKITDRHAGHVVFDDSPYKKRMLQHINSRKIKPVLVLVALLSIALGVAGFAVPAGGFSVIWCVVFGGGGAFILYNATKETIANYVGPEPFQRMTEDFGAATPDTPADHPTQVDLSYKPTA